LQFFCFLATKAHFSSSWTSRVEGGKGHQLVVGGLRVDAGLACQPGDGVLVDAHQPGGLADAAAVGEVSEDGQDFVVGEFGIEQRCALELGEAGLAGAAVEQAMSGPGEVSDDEEVVLAASAVEVAVGILAAEAVEVVRGGHASSEAEGSWRMRVWTTSLPIARILFNLYRTPPFFGAGTLLYL
jgi:hypothetical protein